MSKLVMLDVYSGRPNPVWEIDEGDARGFVAEGSSALSDAEGPSLGYRGFKILDAAGGVQEMAGLSEGNSASYAVESHILGNHDAERALLEAGTRSGAIDQTLAGFVAGEIGNVQAQGALVEGIGVTCPPCGGGAAPGYDPGYWNNDATRLRNNNCYNYANNLATNTFAQPGRATGAMAATMSCADVRPCAERDGLIRVPTYQASQAGIWYVALVIWPGQDYHWYRQDNNGCWSHKPGQTEARNVDNGGNRIADPATCNRGPYSDFCCYMTTRPNANIR